MCRPREALTLKTEPFPPRVSVSVFGHQSQPQHKHARWRLRGITFNKINFLGENVRLDEQSDFDWSRNVRMEGSAAPQLLQITRSLMLL